MNRHALDASRTILRCLGFPGNFGHRWNLNGESQDLNGTAMGQQMAGMIARTLP